MEFNEDTVYGMLWSARNGESTGSHTLDAMQYARGKGRKYEADPNVKVKLDPANKAYNPYAVGSTVDEAAEYFGMNGFNQKWLDDNKSILTSGDEMAIKYYQQVSNAEQFTQQAESEIQKLYERINARLGWAASTAQTIDANTFLKDALDGLDALQKMDEGLVNGELAPLTRPLDYRWQDVATQVNDQVQVNNARRNAPHNPAELDMAALQKMKTER